MAAMSGLMVKPSAAVFNTDPVNPEVSKACLLMIPTLKTINMILMKKMTAKIILKIQRKRMMVLIIPKILPKKKTVKTIALTRRKFGLNAPVRVVTAIAKTKFGTEPIPMASLTGT